MTTTDQPFFDPTAYGNGPDDSVTDTSEGMAITHHTVRIGGRDIAYTAHAGHLVTVDPSSSQPVAKMFHVAFVADAPEGGARIVIRLPLVKEEEAKNGHHSGR